LFNGTLEAFADGAHASGLAHLGNVEALATGSFAHGVNVRTNTVGGVVFGVCNNATAESLTGSGTPIFAIGTGAFSTNNGCDSLETSLMMDDTGDLYIKGNVYVEGTVTDGTTMELRRADRAAVEVLSNKVQELESELKSAREELAELKSMFTSYLATKNEN
ncbi:hypothetical protein QOT17_011933, partial [Balamuthia mandrillaris]